MSTIFTRIINRELPGRIIAETDEYISFLDIRPMREGHALCVPKREVDYYFDLTAEELAGLAVFSKQVAAAIEAVVPCTRIATAVLGLEVPHAHLHLVPIVTERDFKLGSSVKVSAERMNELEQQISAAYAEQQA